MASAKGSKEGNGVTKVLHHIFIDGLNGMALGLFSTLLIGTIIEQIGNLIPGQIGVYLVMIAAIAKKMMGFGIGVGVAAKFKRTPLAITSAGVAGMIGAFGSQMLAGTLLNEGVLSIVGVGEPVGAFVAAFVASECAGLIEGRTKLDILLVPSVAILTGGAISILLGSPIATMMKAIGDMINWGAEQHSFIAGIVVAVLMGMALTLPISSAAIGISLGLSGVAAGAATIGCCANMVGFAVCSFRENGVSGLISQGIGTSMLQMPNILRRPQVWLPAILTSAILGPVSTCLLHLVSNATGSGMGTCGLVGPWMMYQTMVSAGTDPVITIIEIITMCVILPGIIALGISEAMRKLNWIKAGDLKLEV